MKALVKTKRVNVVGYHRGTRGKKRNTALINKILSSQINKQRVLENSQVLEVGETGIVMNLDYNNSQHMKWFED